MAPPPASAGGGAVSALPEPAQQPAEVDQEHEALPEASPEPAAEIGGRVRAALDTFEGAADLTPLRGKPELLDVLDTELAPTHPARAGLRVDLFHAMPDGRLRIVPRFWEEGLPTLLRVSRLVAAGEIEPGDFVVKLRLGFKTTPNIYFSVGDPHPTRRRGNDGIEDALRILRVLKSAGGAEAPAPDLAAVVKGAVSEAVAPLQARIDELEEQLAGEAAGDVEEGVGTGLAGKLIDKFADKLLGSGDDDEDDDDDADQDDDDDGDEGGQDYEPEARRADARSVAGRGRK